MIFPRSRVYLVGALMVLALIVTGLPLPGGVKFIFALLATLILPGYALGTMLVPEMRGRAERVALTLGLSFAVCVIGGLLLNLSASGVESTSWAIWLAVVTFGSLLATGITNRQEQRRPPPVGATVTRLSTRQNLYLIGAGGLLVAAAAITALGAGRDTVPGFSTLSLLPQGAGRAQLQVHNDEHAPALYRLELVADDVLAQSWPEVRLNPGETWREQVALPEAQMVEARLYAPDLAAQEPYRRVWLRGRTP